jgi:hypothetical protein
MSFSYIVDEPRDEHNLPTPAPRHHQTTESFHLFATTLKINNDMTSKSGLHITPRHETKVVSPNKLVYLNSSDKNLLFGGLLNKSWCFTIDLKGMFCFYCRNMVGGLVLKQVLAQ